jgi:hypothetical protein
MLPYCRVYCCGVNASCWSGWTGSRPPPGVPRSHGPDAPGGASPGITPRAYRRVAGRGLVPGVLCREPPHPRGHERPGKWPDAMGRRRAGVLQQCACACAGTITGDAFGGLTHAGAACRRAIALSYDHWHIDRSATCVGRRDRRTRTAGGVGEAPGAAPRPQGRTRPPVRSGMSPRAWRDIRPGPG